MGGCCASWDSPVAVRGLVQCSYDNKVCTKVAVKKENYMSASAGIFAYKRTVCEKNKCAVHKIGMCVDVGKNVFVNCKKNSATNAWTGTCLHVDLGNYAPDMLERDL